MKYHNHIININLISRENLEPESDVPCGTCHFCCEKLTPFLTPEEISSGLYPISLVNQDEKVIENQVFVSMAKNIKTGGCIMLVDGKCSIYNYRPKACKQFDCRKNHHPSIPNMIGK
jgi:Fe-S-cluster containining protein